MTRHYGTIGFQGFSCFLGISNGIAPVLCRGRDKKSVSDSGFRGSAASPTITTSNHGFGVVSEEVPGGTTLTLEHRVLEGFGQN
jgi:hypothetical protein